MDPESHAGPGGCPDRLAAVVLFLVLVVVYNANGREIGSYDTQPTKFAARELLLRGTLTLNHVVGATPDYTKRWGFILAADGHYRSVYSPVPAVVAAAVTFPLWKTGLIDIQAPLAPALMAALTASVVVAFAVALAFLTAREWLPRGRALWLATGLGLGTGLWSTASQTLWQTECAVLGLAVAVRAFAVVPDRIRLTGAAAIGVGLGLAGATRPQLAPAVALLLAGTAVRSGLRRGAIAAAIVGVFVAVTCTLNVRWFGHPLGALPLLQDVNARLHATSASFVLGFEGFAGLLVSPNRGLLVYSPVVLVAFAGIRRGLAEGRHSPVWWCVAALAGQYCLYSVYAVWWGGHTFGPRYLIDVLPLAVPVAAAAMAPVRVRAATRLACAAALAWSVVVAATGAFCYPHERWNVDPADVDRNHARLWSLSDTQIVRCWKRGPSPQNFSLLDRAAVRRVSR